jgi:hypothetical protein
MSRLTRSFVLVMALLALSAPTVMYAFSKPFSPTSHSHDIADLSHAACASGGRTREGKLDYNGTVRVRTTMSWNAAQAQNVRNYASGGRYYTHDITDDGNPSIQGDDNLDGWCLWTNFPSAYYDWDNDYGSTLRDCLKRVAVRSDHQVDLGYENTNLPN